MFRLLGPVEFDAGGQTVVIGSVKQRTLLAVLLLRAGEPVRLEELIAELWGPAAPRSAIANLRTYVSVLRASAGEQRIVTTTHGYQFVVRAGELDAIVFADSVRDARAAVTAGDFEQADSLLTTALGLWRGAAAQDTEPRSWLAGMIAELEEQRLSAVSDYVDVKLALRQHVAVVPWLRDLVSQHPEHDRLCEQLRLAVSRCCA
ncbi:AfsR/SARP family transcriptional regulator [Labedaea rhizosphaerae]|uniref:Transcriptional regulator n=1 Tax=Labedaea rhizosphaerae TaxID=598644 RepID=A0A4R6SAW6_LABRH|nr:BTAD domain-containing putative transcriptional regulator [Labedaea rhizosphaerae]TDP97080.1 transcriptional regulator [Labedaea rhizosphaerae]